MEDKKEKDRVLVSSMISLAKLIEGGAAMLHLARINHQNVIAGNRVSRPLLIYILRLCVVS